MCTARTAKDVVRVDLFRVEADIFGLQITSVAYDHVQQENACFFAKNPISGTCRQLSAVFAHKLHNIPPGNKAPTEERWRSIRRAIHCAISTWMALPWCAALMSSFFETPCELTCKAAFCGALHGYSHCIAPIESWQSAGSRLVVSVFLTWKPDA